MERAIKSCHFAEFFHRLVSEAVEKDCLSCVKSCTFLGELGMGGFSYRVSLKKRSFNEIGTPGGPKTILRVGDGFQNAIEYFFCWSGVPIYPFSYHL